MASVSSHLMGQAQTGGLAEKMRRAVAETLAGIPDPGEMMAAMAQAAPSVQFTIQAEMRAWANDHNPAHLLRVIDLQRNLLEHQGQVMGAAATQSSHLAAALDHAMGVASQGSTVVSSVGKPKGSAVKTPKPAPLATAAVGGRTVSTQGQAAMTNLSDVMRVLSDITKAMHDTQKAIIRNLK